jgi:hypothetical protein
MRWARIGRRRIARPFSLNYLVVLTIRTARFIWRRVKLFDHRRRSRSGIHTKEEV